MLSNTDTLIDRLDNIVDSIHINEVKKIIHTLSKINSFKHIIEDDLCTDSIYNKIAYELKSEFKINNLKIVQLTNNVERVLFQLGNNDSFTYNYISKVSKDTIIIIFIEDKELTSFQELTLNSYFNEIVHLLYIQFILNDLQESTFVDPLTKLKNRLSFNQEMSILIPLALREKMNIGVLLINIDRFRAVNDEHGDIFGDQFLILYANTIKDIVRTSDVTVRFSGGEFLVLLVNIESELKTIEIAEKIRKKLSEVYLKTLNNDKFKKTVCIGVSMFPLDDTDINNVVKNAEIALSDARDNGRDTILRFEPKQESTIDFF
ncbi:MAG: GGDEF domain-containing protein [Campylobacterota bacterium]|nr:GGDEF domain-containing protein [Campylobacterota bacterium]